MRRSLSAQVQSCVAAFLILGVLAEETLERSRVGASPESPMDTAAACQHLGVLRRKVCAQIVRPRTTKQCNLAKCDDPACPEPLICSKPSKKHPVIPNPKGNGLLRDADTLNKMKALTIKKWKIGSSGMTVTKGKWGSFTGRWALRRVTKCYPYVPHEIKEGRNTTVVCSKSGTFPIDHSEFLHSDPGCLDWSNKYAELRWVVGEEKLELQQKKNANAKWNFKKLKYEKKMRAAESKYGQPFNLTYCERHPKRHRGFFGRAGVVVSKRVVCRSQGGGVKKCDVYKESKCFTCRNRVFEPLASGNFEADIVKFLQQCEAPKICEGKATIMSAQRIVGSF